jgi:NTE family protein
MKGVKRLILSHNQLEFDREAKMTLIEGKFLLSYDPYIGENDDRLKRFRRFVAMAFPKISIANMFISLILMKNPKEAE